MSEHKFTPEEYAHRKKVRQSLVGTKERLAQKLLAKCLWNWEVAHSVLLREYEEHIRDEHYGKKEGGE